MARLFQNNVTSELANSISAIETVVQIVDPSAFPPSVPAGLVFTVTLESRTTLEVEICHCTAITGDLLTLVRAQEGTTAKAFDAFDLVESRLTAAALDEFLIDPPTAGDIYVRTDGSWVLDPLQEDAPPDGRLYCRRNNVWFEFFAPITADAPTNGSNYARKDAAWNRIIPGAEITTTPPPTPINGQLWWESDSGGLFVSYNDGNSTQWVQVNGDGFGDAPQTGVTFGRMNGAWNPVLPVTGGAYSGSIQIYPSAGAAQVALKAANIAPANQGSIQQDADGHVRIYNAGKAWTFASDGTTWTTGGLQLGGSAVVNGALTVTGSGSAGGNWSVGGQINAGGAVVANGNVVVGNGQTSSSITMTDVDNGTMYVHCNSGNIGFLNNGGSWISYTRYDGNMWTAATGWITDYVVNQASYYAQVYSNSRFHAMRFSGGGDYGVNLGGWAGAGAEVIMGVHWVYSQIYLIDIVRIRYLQTYSNNSGWQTVGTDW